MTWRKSSFSDATGECVEVAHRTEAVGVRDSKNPSGPVLAIDPSGWSALLRTLD
jgi:hypothetical protein